MQKKTYIVGVTGGIGSGKTVATDRFQHHQIQVIDADTIAHQVVAIGTPALAEITAHFGQNILLPSGDLNRKLLRECIFTQATEKQWLENLLHPIIRQTIIDELRDITSPYGILSSPLLFETQQNALTDSTLVIDCPEELQIKRALTRDSSKSSRKQIKAIMASQLSRQERLKKADNLIVNSGSLEELHQSIDNYHFDLIQRLHKHDISSQ